MKFTERRKCWGLITVLVAANGCWKSPEPKTVPAPIPKTIKISPPTETIPVPPRETSENEFRDFSRRIATDATLFLQNKIWMQQGLTFQLECDPDFTAIQEENQGEIILTISGTVKSQNGVSVAIPIKKRERHLKCLYKMGEWSCETSFSELVEIGRMGNYGK